MRANDALLRILQQCQAGQKEKRKPRYIGMPHILEAIESSREYRKSWARLIQKIYDVDPLTCPECQGRMRIISFIEDQYVIRKIPKHLGLWDVKARPRPRPMHCQNTNTLSIIPTPSSLCLISGYMSNRSIRRGLAT